MKADGRIIALSAFLFATIKLPASARPFALFATFPLFFLQLWDVKEFCQKTKVCPETFKAEDFY